MKHNQLGVDAQSKNIKAGPQPDLDTLEVIADWKDDLRARIARTQLIFELCDCDVDFQPLVEEVQQFKKCCRCLMWRARQ